MDDIKNILGIDAGKARTQETATGGAARGLVSRYHDGYKAAGFIVGFGTVVKYVAALAGFGIAIVGLVIANQVSGGSSVAIVIAGVLSGILVWFAGFVAGIIVSAQGQLLLAALDTAVNTSQFLVNSDRASIMGL